MSPPAICAELATFHQFGPQFAELGQIWPSLAGLWARFPTEILRGVWFEQIWGISGRLSSGQFGRVTYRILIEYFVSASTAMLRRCVQPHCRVWECIGLGTVGSSQCLSFHVRVASPVFLHKSLGFIWQHPAAFRNLEKSRIF